MSETSCEISILFSVAAVASCQLPSTHRALGAKITNPTSGASHQPRWNSARRACGTVRQAAKNARMGIAKLYLAISPRPQNSPTSA
jgi:hypothetical protein